MNKRQSKKQELQAQVDYLQAKVDRFGRSSNVNVDIADGNFKAVSTSVQGVKDNVQKLSKIQTDMRREVRNNRMFISDIQKQLKYVNLNSIVHSIAISILSAAIVFISIR